MGLTWEDLTAEARAGVDDHLARGHVVAAAKVVRDDFDGGPGRGRPGIHPAVDLVVARLEELGRRP